jgi:hypothetical protein
MGACQLVSAVLETSNAPDAVSRLDSDEKNDYRFSRQSFRPTRWGSIPDRNQMIIVAARKMGVAPDRRRHDAQADRREAVPFAEGEQTTETIGSRLTK